MQFSYDWLKIQANPNLSADEMAHLLTMSGLEVEEVETGQPPVRQGRAHAAVRLTVVAAPVC